MPLICQDFVLRYAEVGLETARTSGKMTWRGCIATHTLISIATRRSAEDGLLRDILNLAQKCHL
jgi:hypothetical protein